MPKPKGFKGAWRGRKAGNYEWYEIQDTVAYYESFEKPKIIYLKFQVKPAFVMDLQNTYSNDANFIYPKEDYYLLGILNSKLGWFLIAHTCTEIQNGYQLIYDYFKNIPIPHTVSEQTRQTLSEQVRHIITLKQHQKAKVTTFLNRLADNLTLDKPSKKLETFYTHDFKTFLSELKKKKVTLSLVQQDEWEAYFNAYKTELTALQAEIDATDRDIDAMVYELYGLSDEEIAVVEGRVG